MDEDIFIGKDFFNQIIQEFHHIEEYGEYRIGFAVPVIPLNCCGCVSYLNVIGKKEEYEKRFGRIYRSRFNDIYREGQAEFLWDTIENFDDMADEFLENRMGRDERFIYEDNQEKDLAIYEIGSVLAGHLAFGPQKKHMLKYYEKNPEKFAINRSTQFL